MSRLQRLRRWLRENGWNLILSMAFTVLIMLMINDELQASWPDVEVTIKLSPPQAFLLDVVGQEQLKRRVTLRGPREKLTQFKAQVDAQPHGLEITHRIDREVLQRQLGNEANTIHNTNVSRNDLLEVLPVDIVLGPGAEFPWTIEYKLDKIVEIQRPLDIKPQGDPKIGYRIGGVESYPQLVTLRGPAKSIGKINRVVVQIPLRSRSAIDPLEKQLVNAFESNLPQLVECLETFDATISIVPDDIWWSELPVHPADRVEGTSPDARRQFLNLTMQFQAPIGYNYLILPYKAEARYASIVLDIKAPRDFLEKKTTRELLELVSAYCVIGRSAVAPTIRGPNNERITNDSHSADVVHLNLPEVVSYLRIAESEELPYDEMPRNRDGNAYGDLLAVKFKYEVKEP